MLSQPFWGSLITRLELRDWDEPTFATNGKYLFVPKPSVYKDWTFKQILGVLAHETWHCAAGHVFRKANRDAMKWNIAADYATNYILTTNHYDLPKGTLFDEKYKGMTAEKIYNMLPDPIIIEIPMDLVDPGKGKGKGKDSKKGGSDSKDGKEETEAVDVKELAQEWKEAVTSAARIAKGRGNMPGGLEEYIDEMLFPKVPWQQILYRYLQAAKGNTDFTAYPFDRRHIYRDVFLPSMQGDSIEIVSTIDSSGSISHEDLVRYISEIRGICSQFGSYTIYLFIHDTEVHKSFIIEDDSTIPNFVVGRGGTSHIPVFKKIENENLNELPVVCFTDLDTEFPSNYSGNSVFWLIRKEQNRYDHKVPFGEIIEIDD